MMNPLTVLEYISSTIEILLSMKLDDNDKKVLSSLKENNYEDQLQQIEKESREHIGVFYKLKYSRSNSTSNYILSKLRVRTNIVIMKINYFRKKM